MLSLEKLTIDTLLKQAFEKYADLPSIAFAGEKSMSYAELEKAIRERMEDLRAYGLGPGARIVILGDNCPNWVIAYLAVTFLGAVAVPILPGFSEENVRHIVQDSESVAVLAG